MAIVASRGSSFRWNDIGVVPLMMDCVGPAGARSGKPQGGFETRPYISAAGVFQAVSMGRSGLCRNGIVQWVTIGNDVFSLEVGMKGRSLKALLRCIRIGKRLKR